MSWRQNLNISNLSPEDFINPSNKVQLNRFGKESSSNHNTSLPFPSDKQISRNYSSEFLRASLQKSKSPIKFRSPNPGGKNLFPPQARPRGLIKNIILDLGFKQSFPKARKKLDQKQESKFTEELTKFPVFNIANMKLPQKETRSKKNVQDSAGFSLKKTDQGQKKPTTDRNGLTPSVSTKQIPIINLKQQLKKQLFKNDIIKIPQSNSQIRKERDKISAQRKQNNLDSHQSFPFQRMAPRNHKFEIPKKEDFEIGRPLGKGQYGEVMVVRHKKTGFLCAMKVMSKKVIRQQNYVNQIVRQLSIQSYLAHRNIAPLYGYFSDSENVYLLVQFCEGGQLYNKIKKQKRIPEKETSEITKQILEGLDYIHKQQIIHRDLKPENILFASEVVKISDFGWAVFSNAGFRRTVSGSPLYYPPEIVKGEQYDEKIDLWNVGMMVYECLLGKIPFRIYSQLDLDKIVSDQITFPDYIDVSEVAKDFIMKTMRKSAEERMEIREMLRHQFIKQYESKSYLIGVESDLNNVLR